MALFNKTKKNQKINNGFTETESDLEKRQSKMEDHNITIFKKDTEVGHLQAELDNKQNELKISEDLKLKKNRT